MQQTDPHNIPRKQEVVCVWGGDKMELLFANARLRAVFKAIVTGRKQMFPPHRLMQRDLFPSLVLQNEAFHPQTLRSSVILMSMTLQVEMILTGRLLRVSTDSRKWLRGLVTQWEVGTRLTHLSHPTVATQQLQMICVFSCALMLFLAIALFVAAFAWLDVK